MDPPPKHKPQFARAAPWRPPCYNMLLLRPSTHSRAIVEAELYSVGQIFRGFLALKAAVFGVIILVLWLRSYAVADSFRKGVEPQYIELGSARGSVIVRFGHDGNQTQLVGSWRRVRAAEPADLLAQAGMYDSAWNRIGFGYTRQLVGSPPRGVIVNLMLPHWLV